MSERSFAAIAEGRVHCCAAGRRDSGLEVPKNQVIKSLLQQQS